MPVSVDPFGTGRERCGQRQIKDADGLPVLPAGADRDNPAARQQVDLRDGHLNAQDGGPEWDGKTLPDHDVKTGELLELVEGVDGGLLDQSIELRVAQFRHGLQPTEVVRVATQLLASALSAAMLRIVRGCALVRTVKSAGAHRRRLSVRMVARELASDHRSRGFGGSDGEGVVAEAGDEVELAAECLHVAGDGVDSG
jgi:hypothetical protein